MPGAGDKVNINLSEGASPEVNDTVKMLSPRIGWVGSGALNIRKGARVDLAAPEGNANLGVEEENKGTINHTGGKVDVPANAGLRLGVKNGSGEYQLSGGTLNLHGGDLVIGNSGAGLSEFAVTGGEAVNIGEVKLGADASGVFTLHGPRFENVQAEGWTQSSNGKLRVEIGKNASTVHVDGDVKFAEGAVLDVSWEEFPVYGYWDIITWNGDVLNEGLKFADSVDQDIWQRSLIDTNQDGKEDTLRISTAADADLKGAWRAVDGPENIRIAAESFSKPADAGDTVRYPLVVMNPSEKKVSVDFSIEKDDKNGAGTRRSPTSLTLAPGETVAKFFHVTMHKGVSPGEYIEDKVNVFISGAEEPQAEITFKTVRKMDYPYLLHTREGWNRVKDKMEEHQWARNIADDIIHAADSYGAPGTNTENDDYVFHRRVMDARHVKPAIAYSLTGDKKYAEKGREYLLTLSDPEHGYPATRRAQSHGDVQEGQTFRMAAFLYDAIHDSAVLTEEQHKQIRHTFRLFLKDTAETMGKNMNLTG